MGASFVRANGLRFAYLREGPGDAPLALCAHGFPDHARTFRHLAPRLVAAGYRVVAPWLRGYAPTALPPGRVTELDTLAADLNALHRAVGGTGRAVLVGHDWGAIAGYRAAAAAPDRWRRVVAMAVPPEPALLDAAGDLDQARRSWYTVAAQLPGAERLFLRDDLALIDRLWADWSPGYTREPEDRGALKATLRSPGTMHAALGYYRGVRRMIRRGTFPRRWGVVPPQPTLYLHGRRDGALGAGLAEGTGAVLPHPDSRAEVLDGVGHFLHLEDPRGVGDRVVEFVT